MPSAVVAPELRLDSHVVVVTGANTGIGYETARGLFFGGARVVMAVRNRARGEAAKSRLEADAKAASANVGTLDLMMLDLASFASIRSFVASFKDKYDRLDVLINNAGLFSKDRRETEDGFEFTFGVNYLGSFLLTMLLLDLLKRSAPSRIVNVSSIAAKNATMFWDDLQLKNNFEVGKAYSQSKLAQILFTRQLALQLEGSGVTAYSLHPGVVRTQIWKNLPACLRCLVAPMKLFFKSSSSGAKTTLYCASALELSNVSGRFYADSKEARMYNSAKSEADATKLWEVSCQLVGWEEA